MYINNIYNSEHRSSSLVHHDDTSCIRIAELAPYSVLKVTLFYYLFLNILAPCVAAWRLNGTDVITCYHPSCYVCNSFCRCVSLKLNTRKLLLLFSHILS